MSALTTDAIDQMSKMELRHAAKQRNIKYGKLSLLQIREALKSNPEEIEMSSKKKAVAKKAPAKKKVGKTGDGPSKMDLAVEIYKANKNAPRKKLIELFMKDAGLTKAGAGTYVQLVRKKLS